MTVNFKNSAGTDLDSLFSITNGNAGALGFKEAGGQDLGNRYATGSLGTNIGYKNSAGTDIGYLRGKTVKPTATVSISRDRDVWGSCTEYGCDSGGENCTGFRRKFYYTATAKVTISNSQPITSVTYRWQFMTSETRTVTVGSISNQKLTGGTYYDIGTNTSTSLSDSKYVSVNSRNKALISCGNGEFHTRCIITITNSAGSNTYTTGTLYTNEDT